MSACVYNMLVCTAIIEETGRVRKLILGPSGQIRPNSKSRSTFRKFRNLEKKRKKKIENFHLGPST